MILSGIGMLASCVGGDGVLLPLTYPEDAAWQLSMNHHAIQLSLDPPYNTLQLETTLQTLDGEPWSLSGQPTSVSDSLLNASPTTWVSTDSSKVRVSATGLITARAVATGTVFIIAKRQVLGITHADSARVRVADVSPVPALDTFRVQPAATDSAKKAVRAAQILQVTTKTSAGQPISSLPVYLKSLNPSILDVSGTAKWATTATRSVTGQRPGDVTLVAETWAYGVTMTDTVHLIVGYPLSLGVSGIMAGCHRANCGFNGNSLTRNVGPGAIVLWTNATSSNVPALAVPVDIVFDDPTNVLPALLPAQNSGGGDILGLAGDPGLPSAQRIAYRRFVTPGEYHYRVLPFGDTGTVVVHDR